MVSLSRTEWLARDPEVRRSRIGAVLAVAAILCISIRPVLVKLAYVEVRDPTTILAMRMGYCWPIALVLLLASTQQKVTVNRALTLREKSLLVFMGLSGFYLSSYLDFWSLEYLSAGTSRLITYSYPTFVMVLSILILKRWPTIPEVGALVMTYSGLVALLVGSASIAGPEMIQGAFLAWLSAAFFALYLVLNSSIGRSVGSIRATSIVIVVGATACVLQFLLTRDLVALNVSWRIYVLTAGMALVTTIVPVYLTTEAMIRIGANRMALIGSLGPVLSVGMGVIILGDRLGAPQGIGAFLILAGVVWVATLR
jgi:drug/metabolite transporter (DMT)-like permease